MFCARHFFCSQVFKTTSNVLNFDVNSVNIALIAFCSAGGDKVGYLTNLEFTLVWVAGRSFATVVVCQSFALIEFSLKTKDFSGSLIALCPQLTLSRFVTLAKFGTLGEFGTVAE